MIGVICTLFKFQSADIVVIWYSDFNRIGCFVDFIHHNYVVWLLLITLWSVCIGKFHRIFVELFSAIYAFWCWYHGMYFLINPCFSSKRISMYLQTLSWRSRYFVGERPLQPNMMWWMVSFSTQQIRHVSSSSILMTCFLIYLVEIVRPCMAATADSVDLFRVEDSSHWLDCSLWTWGWSRYFAKYPCIFLLLNSALYLLIRRGFDGELLQQFCHGSQFLNVMANFITIFQHLLVDRFFSSGYLPLWR